eukprot:TRINITY_DN9399_c0_g1_i2.p1 TRINITY_DN9399_c0_g1~~TRINITY_DN9399_c0_g1_i2.p1  ORF type:complete len:221 (+),score=78.45 TRINITY_DN9399_c0_g1_i2:54-716(+)
MRVQASSRAPLILGTVVVLFVLLCLPQLGVFQSETVAVVRGGDHSLPKYVTLQQLRSWNREGFLKIPAGMSSDKVDTLRRFLDEMQAEPARKGGLWKYFEADKNNQSRRLLNRIEKFTSYHKGMKEFVNMPFVRGVAEDVLGGPVNLFKEKVNYKLPGGGGFEPHQDMQPGWTKYAPQMLSVLLCADENTAVCPNSEWARMTTLVFQLAPVFLLFSSVER